MFNIVGMGGTRTHDHYCGNRKDKDSRSLQWEWQGPEFTIKLQWDWAGKGLPINI